jgi:uncharacterized protein YggU (UPF0235/DUF167 family)
VILAVRLNPKSSRDEIAGIEDRGGACLLKARVRAIPKPAAPTLRSKR